MRTMLLTIAAAILLLPQLSFAAEHTVSQENKKFIPDTLTIKVGDTVTFVNNDKGTHNVYSQSKPGKFNTGSIKSGESADVTFDAPGKLKVKCAIHPKMKMTITVTE